MCVSGYPTLPVKNGPTLTVFFTFEKKKIVFGPKVPVTRVRNARSQDACFHALLTGSDEYEIFFVHTYVTYKNVIRPNLCYTQKYDI